MTRHAQQALTLPESICLRVTRNCNARCRFCLAPAHGEQPSAATLKARIDWLLGRGVKTIHFCGGEPTVHPALAELLTHAYNNGGRCRLTSNAIAIPDTLPSILRTTETEVKVSLHGDQEHHNAMVGVRAFQHTTRNIKRLVSAGVKTSIQGTVVAGHSAVIDWLSGFCLDAGIRRLSILPFIPRGNGSDCRHEFALTPVQRRALRDLIKKKRHRLNGRLDLRWLDFTARPLPVVEADGRVIFEAATEAMDELLCNIPA